MSFDVLYFRFYIFLNCSNCTQVNITFIIRNRRYYAVMILLLTQKPHCLFRTNTLTSRIELVLLCFGRLQFCCILSLGAQDMLVPIKNQISCINLSAVSSSCWYVFCFVLFKIYLLISESDRDRAWVEGGAEGEREGGWSDWVMGTEGGTWRDEHWVLCYMLANWTPIKKCKELKNK